MSPLGLVVFNGVLALAAVLDLRTMRIPNWIPALLAVGAVVAAFPESWPELGARAASAALVGIAGLALWLKGLWGGGDYKLLAAASLWIPVHELGEFAVLLAIIGGMQGLVALAVSTPAGPSPRRRRRMPYALSIAFAGLCWSLLPAA